MNVRDDKIGTGKLAVMQWVILLLIVVFVVRLWNLQVASAGKFEAMAQENRIRKVPILAPRGKILDRNGTVIVDNYPSFSALLLREQMPKEPDAFNANVAKIAAGLHVPEQELRDKLKHLTGNSFQPVMVKEDITPDEEAFIEAHRDELPELETIKVYRRLYPKNGFMAHLIGYVGEVSEDMLNQPQYELYDPGDVVGKSGVEQSYNDMLIGTDGYRRALVNSRGKEVGRLNSQPAVPGKPLKLTIDLDLQIAAEEALGDRKGAIVAMDPRNGEVLAMVSRPAFDPNEFAVKISSAKWNEYLTDPGKPLLNKAIQAQLAPGSTFKIIMSVAGWQEGIARNLNVNCTGVATFYGRPFKCWVYFKHQSHGAVDLTKAIYQSCDIFFYNLAERLGIEKIAKWAHNFGLGERTGIDLPQEVTGVMPSEEWKIKLFKQKWFAGETISVGIGQGAITVTPIQLARAIGAIASDGRLVRPHVAFPDDLPQTPYFTDIAKRDADVQQIPVDPAGWELITNAMARVVNPEGTAPSAHLPGTDFAGKTGSAQVVSIEHAKENAEKYKQNSWFVGVTPRRNPELVVACLFEGGEHGLLSARLVAQIVHAYVEKQRKLRGNSFAAVDKDGNPVQVSGIWSDGLRDDHHSDKLDYGTLVYNSKDVELTGKKVAVEYPQPATPVASASRVRNVASLPVSSRASAAREGSGFSSAVKQNQDSSREKPALGMTPGEGKPALGTTHREVAEARARAGGRP